MLLKVGKRRIEFDTRGSSTLEFLSEQCAAHRFDVFPMVTDTLAALERLPTIYRDPFDRLLICQAIEHGLTIVTPDPAIRRSSRSRSVSHRAGSQAVDRFCGFRVPPLRPGGRDARLGRKFP